MISLEREKDIEILRQAALLLEAENKRLHQRMAAILAEMTALKGGNTSALQLELINLQNQLALRNQKLFGTSSSEKRPVENQAASKTPQTGHGPRKQINLPIVTEVHDLEEADRICPKCGGELREMVGEFEDSEEINVVARRFELVKHKRKKYRCACNECIETALGPTKLFEKARYSIDFGVEVATDKYLDHQPLERQSRRMKRDHLVVSPQTLWDYLDKMAEILEPLMPLFKADVFKARLIHADETRWRMMAGKGEKGSDWWFDWTTCSARTVFHFIQDSRSAEAGKRLLDGYHGTVMADGYGVYGKLSRDGPGFKLAACWAHVRRGYVEIEKNFPQVKEVIDLIRDLYMVEKEVSGEGDQAMALRARPRQEKSRVIVEQIRAWAHGEIARCLPSSELAKAIGYMLGQWQGLTLFLEDPLVPLDNNAAERALRGVVIGRKNHYGSHSERGAQVAALFYTIMESCKLNDVDPRAYLKAAILDSLEGRSSVLPFEFKSAAR